jgi:hypothetical protein
MGTKKPCKRRFRDLNDLRKFVGDLINRVNREEVDAQLAGKMGYLCQILARIIEGSDIEKRLEAVEEQLTRRRIS